MLSTTKTEKSVLINLLSRPWIHHRFQTFESSVKGLTEARTDLERKALENQTSACFQLVASFLLAALDLSPPVRFSLSHEIVTSRLLSGSQSSVAGFHRLGKVASFR